MEQVGALATFRLGGLLLLTQTTAIRMLGDGIEETGAGLNQAGFRRYRPPQWQHNTAVAATFVDSQLPLAVAAALSDGLFGQPSRNSPQSRLVN